ncbi:hypothetical protein FB107DRAFT_280388 [Schizophyllum commune]
MSSSSLCRRSCPLPQLTPSLSSKIAASSASKVESSSASKVESPSASKESSSASKESSSASKDLRGKHNARRFLGSFDDHRIMRGKYKRREGKVTQVYRKKWVINRLLASITAARLPPPSTTRPKSLVKPESSREVTYRRRPSGVMGF